MFQHEGFKSKTPKFELCLDYNIKVRKGVLGQDDPRSSSRNQNAQVKVHFIYKSLLLLLQFWFSIFLDT